MRRDRKTCGETHQHHPHSHTSTSTPHHHPHVRHSETKHSVKTQPHPTEPSQLRMDTPSSTQAAKAPEPGTADTTTSTKTAQSPRILSISWGRIDVSNLGEVKDLKTWPGGGRPWDWNETGTRHDPGIQVADVEELIEHGATTVVLSRGMQCRLGVADKVVEELKVRGLTVHVAETREAVEVYNRLAEAGEGKVGGLFHSTC